MSYVIDTKSFAFNGETLTFGGNELVLKYYIPDPRYLTLTQTQGGTIAANKLSGYDGDTVTLSQTPNNGYVFNNYSITGATLTGSQFNFNGGNVTAKANYTQTATYTATGQSSTFNTKVYEPVTGNGLYYGYYLASIPQIPVKFTVTAYTDRTGSAPYNLYFYGGTENNKHHIKSLLYLPGTMGYGGTLRSAVFSSESTAWDFTPTACGFGYIGSAWVVSGQTITDVTDERGDQPFKRINYEVVYH